MADISSRVRTAVDQPKATGKSILEQVREDDVPFMAASIAYQAFVSLIPLLVLLFFVVALVGDQAVADQVVGMTEGFLPDAAQSLLDGAIAGPGGVGNAGTSLIGFVTLVWGSLKIFRGLDKAFSEIFETSKENSIVDQLRDGAIVFVVLTLSLLAMVIVGSLFTVFGGLLARIVDLLVLVGALTVAFLPMYRYFPDADLSWAQAVPGTVFAAIGWTALQSLFQVYVALSGGGTSGAVGAVLLLLTWLYFGGLVLLLGGVVNAVLLGEGDPRPRTDETEDRVDEADLRECAERLHSERDRRQTLQHELAQARRQLHDDRATASQTGVAQLRTQNRLLRRQLRWEEKSLPERLLLRSLGATPPGREVEVRHTSPGSAVEGGQSQ